MMTVHEVSKVSGVSIRALHHYDAIGLLPATKVNESGYRLYDDSALKRLQLILLFKTLEFPLGDIKTILDSPDFDQSKALEQQIQLLEYKKEHIENLITLAREIKDKGENKMSFNAFDTKKMDEYAKKAKESWGNTSEYKEYEEKSKNRTKDDEKNIGSGLMDIIAKFGSMQNLGPDAPEVQNQVKKLQAYISDHYYKCSDMILSQLGDMYIAGGEMTDNIEAAGGKGTAAFINKAIKAKCNG